MISGTAYIRSSGGMSAPKFQVKISGVNKDDWFDWGNVPRHIKMDAVRSGVVSASVKHNGKPPNRLFGQSLIINWLE